MKRKFLLMASVSLLAAATFCACDKDEKDEKTDENSFTSLTVEVANASNYNREIDTVKLVTIGDSDFSSATILSSAPYANGKFTITLPKVDDKLLGHLIDDDLPSTVTVSNLKVKWTYAALVGYKSGNIVCGFWQTVGDLTVEDLQTVGIWIGGLTYVDGDVTLNGSVTEENKTTTWKNVTAKKGWNILYTRENGAKTSEEITSTAPEGIKWYAY